MDLEAINKTMDRDDLRRPDCGGVILELFGLMRRMAARGAQYSSWYGRLEAWPSIWEHINRGPCYEPWPGNPDEIRVPWFLLWEIAWLTVNTPMQAGQRVLDMGGAGSLFTCFLASRGLEVHSIDLDEGLCRRTCDIASAMNWRLAARPMNMTRLEYPDNHFDRLFSVCVFEHLPVSGRIQCNEEVRRVLKAEGMASFTFDFANPQSFGRLDTPEDVREQFVNSSKLSLRGNGRFHDNGRRYLESPQCFGFGRFMSAAARIHSLIRRDVQPRRILSGRTSYTMGAVFLEKA